MISANELRVGNWVNYKMEDPNMKDTTGPVFHAVTDTDGKHYNPIPITAEILEKCGFEKEITNEPYVEYWWLRLGYNDWEQDFFLQLTDPDAEMDMCNIFSRDNPESNCQILNMPRHVHQLQNLYFVLTGKELEIKFPEKPKA